MEEIEQQEMELTLPRYLPTHQVPDETVMARIPNFLNIDYNAFTPESYIDLVEDVEGENANELRQRIRAQVQNVIRWRYVKDETGKLV